VLELVSGDLGPGARGVFTTRAGGVSGGPYAAQDGSGGLNLGPHVGDDDESVTANRALLAGALGQRVTWMSQVHGARVLTVASPPAEEAVTAGEGDALVALRSGPTTPAVAVMVADCVPLLLATPDGAQVAAVHVGRQGLVGGVVAAALAELGARGAVVEDLYASLGPSICGRCYEVPDAMREDVARIVPQARALTSWGTPALDLPAGVAAQLRAAGVRRVQRLDLCTAEDERFYSYRRDGRTGRLAGVVHPA